MNMFLGIFLQIIDSGTSSGIIESLVNTVVEQGAFASLFLLICIYLAWRLHRKEKENDKLNKYIRSSDKENLKTLNDVNNTLDRVLESQKNSDNIVIKEIQSTKDIVILKIENLADKVDNVDDKVNNISNKKR